MCNGILLLSLKSWSLYLQLVQYILINFAGEERVQRTLNYSGQDTSGHFELCVKPRVHPKISG